MKAKLKLLLKKAREACKEATDSKRIPQARDDSSVAECHRSSSSVVPVLKCQKVQAQVLGSREDATTLPLQRDAPPSAPISTFAVSLASGPASHPSTPAEDHSTLPAKGPISRVNKGKGPAIKTFVNNPDYTFKKMTGVVPKGDFKALLQVSSGALYQRIVLELVKVTHSLSYIVHSSLLPHLTFFL